MNKIDVYMEINLDDNISSGVFPSGYIFRCISREEGHLWETVMNEAFGNYPAGAFEYVMVNNYAYLPERVYVLFDERKMPCGTASAWSQQHLWGEDAGHIIFVGIIPSHRGKGLATQMVLHLFEVIKSRGQKSVLLETDIDNLPAIKSYLHAGFLPHLIAYDHINIWNNIFTQLTIKPVLYSLEIRSPMNNPHPNRPYLLDLREKGYEVK